MKDHDSITLEDIDENKAISISELSPECQRLYDTIAGKSITLNTDDFPDFSKAIKGSKRPLLQKATRKGQNV